MHAGTRAQSGRKAGRQAGLQRLSETDRGTFGLRPRDPRSRREPREGGIGVPEAPAAAPAQTARGHSLWA